MPHSAKKNIVTVGGVGDVFLNRVDPDAAFGPTRDLLHAPDIMFGNCEGAFTDNTITAPSAGLRVASASRNGRSLGPAGFDIMAFTNNHSVDAGREGLLDTIYLLKGQGIDVVGAGANLAEACEPFIATAGGLKIAFLAFTCVYRDGYEARNAAPGVAVLRVHSVPYFPAWDIYSFEPGAQPHMRTFPYPEDLEYLIDAIKKARSRADAVIVSMHWGDSRLPYVLTDYEIAYGRAAIDAGAEAVFGHHHHFVKGIELYQGKPILYGMGHFVFDLIGLEAIITEQHIERLRQFCEYSIFPRAGSPNFPFHADARMTFVAYFDFKNGAFERLALVPCDIVAPDNIPIPLDANSARGREVVAYIEKASRIGGFPTAFGLDGPVIGGRRSVVVRAG